MVADTGLLSWEACKPDFDGSPIYLAAVKDFLQLSQVELEQWVKT
jgi:hypothetical protein